MGASTFVDGAIADNADRAYQIAVAEALHEHGHNSYNGTISTTNGFTMMSVRENETIEEWEHRVLGDPAIQKWENCACTRDPCTPNLWRFAGWGAS